MKNIEVGEWIINQNRLVIGQIIGINEERREATIKIKRLELLIGFWNIRKHSKNIIDLIEVGDYVNGKEVYGEDGKLAVELAEHMPPYELLEDMEIKSILTHEQYEQNCYKVERKKDERNKI